MNPGLSGESRVSWPPRLLGISLCFRPGSNRRPWDYETHALPTAPRKHCCMVFKVYQQVQWPSGLRRSTQVRVSSEAWVRIPREPYFFLDKWRFYPASKIWGLHWCTSLFWHVGLTPRTKKKKREKATNGIRTHDLSLTKRVLYQLSYSGTSV